MGATRCCVINICKMSKILFALMAVAVAASEFDFDEHLVVPEDTEVEEERHMGPTNHFVKGNSKFESASDRRVDDIADNLSLGVFPSQQSLVRMHPKKGRYHQHPQIHGKKPIWASHLGVFYQREHVVPLQGTQPGQKGSQTFKLLRKVSCSP